MPKHTVEELRQLHSTAMAWARANKASESYDREAHALAVSAYTVALIDAGDDLLAMAANRWSNDMDAAPRDGCTEVFLADASGEWQPLVWTWQLDRKWWQAMSDGMAHVRTETGKGQPAYWCYAPGNPLEE